MHLFSHEMLLQKFGMKNSEFSLKIQLYKAIKMMVSQLVQIDLLVYD